MFYALFMLKKYHKEIGFLPCHVGEAKGLIASLKYRNLSFSVHALQELGKEIEAVKIGQVLVNYELNFNDCFEIATFQNRIEKLCFRIKSNEFDIIAVFSREKTLITAWINSCADNHATLDTSAYLRV